MITKTLPFQDPCDVYERLRCLNSVMLESQKNGKHSYIALNPYLIFKSKYKNIEIIKNNKKIIKKGNPLKELEKIILKNKIKRKKNWPLFYGGCIGYFGYDSIETDLKSVSKNLTPTSLYSVTPLLIKRRVAERSKAGVRCVSDLNLPDIYLIFPSDILFFDHKKNILKLVCKNKKSLKKLEEKIQFKNSKLMNFSLRSAPFELTKDKLSKKIKSNFTITNYRKAIAKCKKYIKTGHSFQIKISQRFQFKLKKDPWEIYKNLKQINPSPFAAFLNFEGFQVVSNSPEHLVKVEKGNIETRPIGGTYPRNKNILQDEKNIQKFIADTKEKAEHNMLIDLERNDLGRVAKFGSIKISEKKVVEKYSHLLHIVTNIKAKLAKGKNIFDCFCAMFPGGTITGCPKIRTMEIISEIEPTARGLYTGSIGFMNFSNEMDLNIIIRTLIVKGSTGYIQAGGGIVADSNAQKEYSETISKAKAIFEASL